MTPRYASLDDLSATQLERFQRHLSLNGFGPDAQLKLLNSTVLVVGAGGLGAPVLSYLAAAGVGRIRLVDADVVDRSNLHRQVIHSEAEVGRPKTASAARSMKGLHPEGEVEEVTEWITVENALEMMDGVDAVVDGSDNFSTRYVVSDAAEILGLPVIYGAILRFSGQVSVFWSGHGPTYRDLFPDPPEPGEVPSCAEAGVIGVLPGVIGTLMATETIKVLTGIGQPLLGRLLIYEALEAEFRSLSLLPDPDRQPVREVGQGLEVGLECGRPGRDSCSVDSSTPEAAGAEAGEISVAELRRRGTDGVLLVDVREDWERRLGAIDGAVHCPLGSLRESEGAVPDLSISADQTVVFYCKSGARSAIARDLVKLAQAGGEYLSLVGGYDAWVASRGS